MRTALALAATVAAVLWVFRRPKLACHDCGHHPLMHVDEVECTLCPCGIGK